MVGQEDENMLWQNEEQEEGGEDKSPNTEEDVPDEDIVGVLVLGREKLFIVVYLFVVVRKAYGSNSYQIHNRFIISDICCFADKSNHLTDTAQS